MPRSTAYAAQLLDAIENFGGQQLAGCALSQHGNARWTPSKLLVACVLMSWHEGQTLTSRFEHVREILAVMFPGWAVPASYTGYALALAREMDLLLQILKPQLQDRVKQVAGRQWRWPGPGPGGSGNSGGWIVFAVDGSRFESPRTSANEDGLGCAGKRKTAPQVFHTTLLHLGTNAIWDVRCGPGTDSERRHLEEMAAGLPEGSLVTADAGFIGYELCQRLQQQGVSFLLRVGGNVTLLAEQMNARVCQDGERVWLWPNDHSKSPPCVLRLLRLKRGGGTGRTMFLATNVLDPDQLPLAQAQEIYRRRWGIEVTYRSVKQTLDRTVWLSRTPTTVLAEHQGTLLGFWILQILSLEEIRRHTPRVDPRRWSPALSRDTARRAIRHALSSSPTAKPQASDWRTQLGIAVQDTYVRRGPKQSRDWPHKKRDPPPQPPKIRPLTKQQRRKGLQLLNTHQ
jgi:hypothetical protein